MKANSGVPEILAGSAGRLTVPIGTIGLPLGPLFAVFIKRHRRGIGDVVGVGQAPDGDFHDGIHQRQFIVGQPKPLVANDESRAAHEVVLMQAD